jgi:hypothetical protein
MDILFQTKKTEMDLDKRLRSYKRSSNGKKGPYTGRNFGPMATLYEALRRWLAAPQCLIF